MTAPGTGRRLRTATGRPLANSTIARRMAGVSSWYIHLLANGAIDVNPFAAVERPKVDRDDSSTVGLSDEDICDLLAAAATGRTAPCTRALLQLLADVGLRIGEARAGR